MQLLANSILIRLFIARTLYIATLTISLLISLRKFLSSDFLVSDSYYKLYVSHDIKI